MSVSWGTQYSKLKTNLRLAANRLRLLQKKKTEQAVKARCEIADFLSSDKEDRARIRVETIIREDFVVEAYELLEMYCELLLARFGIIQQMKELDDGIAEAVSSLLWVAPRIGHEIAEFKVINDELTHKYGKQFAEAARMNQLPEPSRVSPKLVQKLSVSAPSKLLVEKYLITIAQSAGINFTPDAKVMRNDDDEIARAERNLINFMNEEQYGWRATNTDHQNGGGNGNGGGHFAVGAVDSLVTPHHNGNILSPPTTADNVVIAPVGGGRITSFSSVQPAAFVPQPSPVASLTPPPEYAPPPPLPAHGGIHQQPQQHHHPMGGYQKQQYADNKSQFDGSVYPSAQPPILTDASSAMTMPYPNAAPHYHKQHQQHQTEHIYELPQERDDDFLLPKLPDPPSHMPANTPSSFAHGDAAGRTTGSTKPSDADNQDLDFDALAKRFEELKKRL